MAVTLVVWNVQTFGDNWPAKRGVNYAPICNFIAQALYAVCADVFIMMELRSGGTRYLPTLQEALNQQWGQGNGWDYDYIPGSVLTPDSVEVDKPHHLGFTQKGHSEGYAVLWRTSHRDFTVLSTRVTLSRNPVNRGSKIGLVLKGRKLEPVGECDYWFKAENFDSNINPYSWPHLCFPESDPVRKGIPRWTQCRRPCCVVLDLKGSRVSGAQRLLPIVVYHAPYGYRSTPWAVQLAAYSAQLYQVDNTAVDHPSLVSVEQAIAAGDFNIDHNEKYERNFTAYSYFTRSMRGGELENGLGGAGLTTTWVNADSPQQNGTAVRLNCGGVPINDGKNVNAYRWLAIDNLFVRNPNTVDPSTYRGPVYNVLSGLEKDRFMVDTRPRREVIRSFYEAITQTLGAPCGNGGFANYPYIDPVSGTPCRTSKRRRDGRFFGPVIGNLLCYSAYMNDLQKGYFRSARRAAEFYVNSISDHLPLVYRFEV